MRLLTKHSNLNTLESYYAWSRLVNKGYFMKGTVKAAKGAVCSKCSRKDCFANSYDEVVGHSIPRCIHCNGVPLRLRVVKVIPTEEGSRTVDIHRDDSDQLLTKIADALGVLGQINKELATGTYRPEKYDSKAKEIFKFKNFADKYIESFRACTRLPEEHDDFVSPGGLRNKINSVNKLKEYFGDQDIREINKFTIIEYYRSFMEKFRTRDLAVGELKTMLRFAHFEMGILPDLPVFPILKKARIKRADEIPTVETQGAIILNISNEQYRDMWILTACLAKRPCEVRAFQAWDVDFFTKTITTARHISKGEAGTGDQIIGGRKSIKTSEELGIVVDPIDDYLLNMLAKYTAGKQGEEFIFPGTYKSFVSEDALNAAWRASCAQLGVRVKPYDGTKHATLTEMLRLSKDFASTKNFSNHTNVITLQRYAKSRAEDKRGLLDTTRFREI